MISLAKSVIVSVPFNPSLLLDWGPLLTSSIIQGVRQKNFNRVKQQIAGSLFQAKPTFVKHLSEIMAAADEIRTINFNYANPNHLYNLQEYSDLQVES